MSNKGKASEYKSLGLYTSNSSIPTSRWEMAFGKKGNKHEDRLPSDKQTTEERR